MYEINFKNICDKINSESAKRVLLQLPDGLKPQAKEIKEELQKRTDAQILIWADSCFGACDLPLEAKNLGVDLLIHFGHTKWRF
ncbi:MAG: diphthamide synthesis protein [Nanoarchaeota archaeon]|nr:diphthamide synthesis protein [Nanoarchaeota archaeon]MBU1030789.1 diphthamide synthesis protein [Nanoarchaeota archaeon]MBU1849981.1 diphthamide synthesis protein [Nanoarchaeota archaeon]